MHSYLHVIRFIKSKDFLVTTLLQMLIDHIMDKNIAGTKIVLTEFGFKFDDIEKWPLKFKAC